MIMNVPTLPMQMGLKEGGRQYTPRQMYAIMESQLRQERMSFEPDWRDLNDYILSRRARFFCSDANKGGRRNQRIIDSTATFSVRTLSAGMMAGITSPAREWKNLTTQDPGVAKAKPVKIWLKDLNESMTAIFLRSNLYNVLPMTYKDMGVFGTAGIFMEEDFDRVVRFYSLPIGSYWIANDEYGQVRTMFRQVPMTVRQVVQKFGNLDWRTGKADWSNISEYVKNCWMNGFYENWVDVAHIIHPNNQYDASRFGAEYSKKYRSCYYELGINNAGKTNYLQGRDKDILLRSSGYRNFPGLFPRWGLSGGDVYATECPGLDVLGDIKQLQHGERKSAKAIDKKVDPAMVAPTSMRNQKASILPGDITYMDVRDGQQGFTPAHAVDFSIKEHEEKQQQVRLRIQRGFYEDLFLMLSQSDRREITAREIEERHEEKLLAVGPVLEQINQDLLDPLIDNTFDIMVEQNLVPPPPRELQQDGNRQLIVEYVSVMAQAQKLIGVNGIERLGGFCGNLAAQTGNPKIIRKINMDKLIDVYAERLGVDPEIVYSDEEVQAQAQADAKVQQAQAAAENIGNIAGAAKDLSQADLTKDSPLKRLMDQAHAGQLVNQ